PTAFFGLTKSDIPEALGLGGAVAGLYAALSPAARTATLKLAEAAKENSRVPITFRDAQNITLGRNDLVKPEVLEAYKKAADTNQSLKNIVRQGYIELGEKNPTALSQILENAATKDIFGRNTSAQPIIEQTETP